MNAKTIILEYIENNNYDGLYNSEGECGCDKDDLFPCCDGLNEDCQPGYKNFCMDCKETDDCNIGGIDWCMSKEKKS